MQASHGDFALGQLTFYLSAKPRTVCQKSLLTSSPALAQAHPIASSALLINFIQPQLWPNAPVFLPQGSIYLNDFARVVSSDYEAVNGVLHFIDRVLLPPDVLHSEADAVPVPRVWPGKSLDWVGRPGSSLPAHHMVHACSSAEKCHHRC